MDTQSTDLILLLLRSNLTNVMYWLHCNTPIYSKSFFSIWIHSGSKTHCSVVYGLTHWDRVTHLCHIELTIIGSDNGLSPGRHQAIIWMTARVLLIRTLGTNFSEIWSEIFTFSFNIMHLKMSSKWSQFCPGLNVLISGTWEYVYGSK